MSKFYNSEQIHLAAEALFEYLRKRKEADDRNLLWDDDEDLNLLIELKLLPTKAKEFRSYRLPLPHSFRKKDDLHEICLIARDADYREYEKHLMEKYPIHGLSKILPLSEFLRDYASQRARSSLCDLFDLFIIHPSVQIFVVSKLAPFLKSRNKLRENLSFPFPFSFIAISLWGSGVQSYGYTSAMA